MISISKFSDCLIFFIFLNCVSKAVGRHHLYVTSDGPAITGANITFYALLSGYSTGSQLTYTFEDGVQKAVSFTSKRENVSFSMTFPSNIYAEGHYKMKVTVTIYEFGFIPKQIAVNSTNFDLQNFLIGEILIYQGNRSINRDQEDIAVGENFTAVVDLHDPNHYLKDAVIDYTWSFDMEHFISTNNSFSFSFLNVGKKIIIVKPKASFPDYRSISGFFNKNLTAKVPINNVTIIGKPFVHHGEFVQLQISCLGTPPFEYCSKILEDNTTADNFTCQISVFNTCHMEINKFLTDGTHHLGIYIGNDVKEVKRVMEILVYSVEIKPTLSTIIIPCICSILTFIIIGIGISFFIRQKNRLAIEVADFDFQDESDSYAGERTFFEKIFDSVMCRNCGQNRLSCVNHRTESDPLLDDELLPEV